ITTSAGATGPSATVATAGATTAAAISATTRPTVAITLRALALTSARRYRACAPRTGLSLALRQHVAVVDPDLDADDPEGRVRLSPRVVDVGAQRLQRHTALRLLLDTRDFRAAETATEDDFHALGVAAHRLLHRLLHRAPERHTFLKLIGDTARHK